MRMSAPLKVRPMSGSLYPFLENEKDAVEARLLFFLFYIIMFLIKFVFAQNHLLMLISWVGFAHNVILYYNGLLLSY